jgi:polysaccharide biosynthesis protein PslJ
MSSALQGAVAEAPSVNWPEVRPKGPDPVRMITIFAVLLTCVPATLIFAALGGTGTPAMVFAFIVLLWYLTAWQSGRLQPSGAGRVIRIALMVFSVAVLASFVAGMTRDINATEVLAADSGLVWLVGSAGIVVVICQSLTDYRRLEVLLRRLVILGCVVAMVGVLQFVGVDLTQVIHIPGLSVNSAAVTNTPNRGGFARVLGTATQPIEFGVVMAMLVPLALQQAWDPAYGGKLRRWVPVTLLAFAATLSIARSAVIGLGVVLIVLFPTWSGRRKINSLLLLPIVLAFMHLLIHGLITTFIQSFQSLFSGSDTSVGSRTTAYALAGPYVTQRPFFGRGFGTLLPLSYFYTDDMYLLAIIEMGILGLVAMIFLFVAGMRTASVGRRRTTDPRRREVGQALVASMAVTLVVSATFDSLTFPIFSGLFFILLGCCGAYCGIMTREASEPTLLPDFSLDPVPVFPPPDDGVGQDGLAGKLGRMRAWRPAVGSVSRPT